MKERKKERKKERERKRDERRRLGGKRNPIYRREINPFHPGCRRRSESSRGGNQEE